MFILLCCVCYNAIAQTDSANADTARNKPAHRQVLIKKQVLKRPLFDSTHKPAHLAFDTITQKADTLKIDSAKVDSTKLIAKDTVKLITKPAVTKKPVDTFYFKLLNNPYLKTKGKPLYFVVSERQRNSKDEVFYVLSGLLLCLALVRLAFSRYFSNIFRLFFQPTFRQKQTREQLLQGSFPSLLLNLFFNLSCGTYISFLLLHYHLTQLNFWWLFLYSTATLLVLYTGKFVLLTLAGWVFDVKEATETYLFAVYLINKILGVVLIPFILIIAFSQTAITTVAITLSVLIIVALFIYRYIVSFVPVGREVKVNLLHFVFYICAFEIIPLLLIYKTLVLYLDKSL